MCVCLSVSLCLCLFPYQSIILSLYFSIYRLCERVDWEDLKRGRREVMTKDENKRDNQEETESDRLYLLSRDVLIQELVRVWSYPSLGFGFRITILSILMCRGKLFHPHTIYSRWWRFTFSFPLFLTH